MRRPTRPPRNHDPASSALGRAKIYAETIAEALWDLDIRADRLTWSEGLGALFGHPRDAVSNRADWRALVHPEDVAALLASFADALHGTGVFWLERFRMRRGDGSYTDVGLRAFIIRDDDGAPSRLVGTLSDVGARRMLEDQLRRVERLDAFFTSAAGIAHDLNNVLSVINLHADLLAMDANTPREPVAELRHAAAQALALTARLQLVGGGSLAARRTVDVNDLITNLVGPVTRFLREDTRLSVRFADDLPCVTGDPDALEQAVLNLIYNARDALGETSGTITLATAAIVRAHPAHGVDAEPASYVEIVVTDTGPGIPEELADRIFEPWFTTKAPGRGTGLGLATAYASVRQHGGWIDVDSAPGRGATFSIYLPANEDARTADARTEPIRPPS